MYAGPSAKTTIEYWSLRKLFKCLEIAGGTSSIKISLIIHPEDEISRLATMLADEFAAASKIKLRKSRLAVLGAVTTAQERLKRYPEVPPKGLIVFCGNVISKDGIEKKFITDFEPSKPVDVSLYLCDNKYHINVLLPLLDHIKKQKIIVEYKDALTCSPKDYWC